MPTDVRKDFGHALYEAQLGKQPTIAKIFKHLGESGVWELVADDREGTFRGIYTVKFSDAIVVLHMFQKKSKSGISTPKTEIDLIRQRLKAAHDIFELPSHKCEGFLFHRSPYGAAPQAFKTDIPAAFSRIALFRSLSMLMEQCGHR